MDVCQLLNVYKFELKGKGSSAKKMAEHSTENQKRKLEIFFKNQKERLDEIDRLRISSKTLQDEIFKLKKELNLLTKENKTKEKANIILNNKNEGLQTKIQKFKEEVMSLNKTKIKLERELKKALNSDTKCSPNETNTGSNLQHDTSNADDKEEKVETDTENENIDESISLICDDCKSEYKDICNHHSEQKVKLISPNIRMTNLEKIKKLIPIEYYYSPIKPLSLSHQLIEKYNKLFGDHCCLKCEHVQQKDYMSKDIFNLTVCKNYYLILHNINIGLKE